MKLAALYHDPEVEAAARQDLGGDGVFKTNDAADLQATTAELEKVIRGVVPTVASVISFRRATKEFPGSRWLVVPRRRRRRPRHRGR